jgi:hypothetical protein
LDVSNSRPKTRIGGALMGEWPVEHNARGMGRLPRANNIMRP